MSLEVGKRYEQCFWATIKIENSHGDLKARILNFVYSWDPRRRLGCETTGKCDSNNLAHLEE